MTTLHDTLRPALLALAEAKEATQKAIMEAFPMGKVFEVFKAENPCGWRRVRITGYGDPHARPTIVRCVAIDGPSPEGMCFDASNPRHEARKYTP